MSYLDCATPLYSLECQNESPFRVYRLAPDHYSRDNHRYAITYYGKVFYLWFYHPRSWSLVESSVCCSAPYTFQGYCEKCGSKAMQPIRHSGAEPSKYRSEFREIALEKLMKLGNNTNDYELIIDVPTFKRVIEVCLIDRYDPSADLTKPPLA